MDVTEFLNQVLLLFGGTSAVLIALATFLGHINTKRIVNGDLAKHKLELEAFKAENVLRLQSIKDLNTKEIELVKLEHAKRMDELQSEFKTEFLKQETYTSISKEKYQNLFDKRIGVYEELLKIKNEIGDSNVENAGYFEFDDDDPNHFTRQVSKISKISQDNLMLISDDLAVISSELYERSSEVFSNAKVQAFYAEMRTNDGGDVHYEEIIDAENHELRKMFAGCGELYKNWFKQLDTDLSRIRKILDTTSDFLD